MRGLREVCMVSIHVSSKSLPPFILAEDDSP
jgi:hypothetical protein